MSLTLTWEWPYFKRKIYVADCCGGMECSFKRMINRDVVISLVLLGVGTYLTIWHARRKAFVITGTTFLVLAAAFLYWGGAKSTEVDAKQIQVETLDSIKKMIAPVEQRITLAEENLPPGVAKDSVVAIKADFEAQFAKYESSKEELRLDVQAQNITDTKAQIAWSNKWRNFFELACSTMRDYLQVVCRKRPDFHIAFELPPLLENIASGNWKGSISFGKVAVWECGLRPNIYGDPEIEFRRSGDLGPWLAISLSADGSPLRSQDGDSSHLIIINQGFEVLPGSPEAFTTEDYHSALPKLLQRMIEVQLLACEHS